MSLPSDIKRIMLRLRAKLADRRNRDVPREVLRFEVESDIREAGLGALHDRPRHNSLFYRSKNVVHEPPIAFVRYTIGHEGHHYRIKATAVLNYSSSDLASTTVEHMLIPPDWRCVNVSFRTLETDEGRAHVARLLMEVRRLLRRDV